MVIYNFIKYLIISLRYKKILSSIYKEEHLLENLSKILGYPLKIDWIGRIYTVINPYIKDGKYDPESVVYELGQDNPTGIMVEHYIMERLNIASRFIRANNLFDLLTYKIEKLDDSGNYLFTMFPIPYLDLKTYTKRFLIVYIPLILVIIGLFIFL